MLAEIPALVDRRGTEVLDAGFAILGTLGGHTEFFCQRIAAENGRIVEGDPEADEEARHSDGFVESVRSDHCRADVGIGQGIADRTLFLR